MQPEERKQQHARIAQAQEDTGTCVNATQASTMKEETWSYISSF